MGSCTSSGNDPMEKIVLVGPHSPSHLGLSEYTAITAGLFAASGKAEVIVLADRSEEAKNESRPNLKVERVWKYNSILTPFFILWAIKKHQPRAVWFNLIYSVFGNRRLSAFVGLLIPQLCRLLGFPTYIYLHHTHHFIDLAHSRYTKKRRWDFWAYELALRSLLSVNEVYVPLDRFKDFLCERYGTKNIKKVAHWFLPGGQKRSNLDTTTLLAFGRFGGYKPLSVVFDVFREVKKQKPEVKLMIAGEDHPGFPGHVKSCLDALEPELRSKINYMGYVPDEHLEEVFTSCGLLLMPYLSLTGVSGVAHWAASFGLPIICPNLPDFVSMAREQSFAFQFYDAGSIRSAAQKTVDLLNNPAEMKRYADHNYQLAQSNSVKLGSGVMLERMLSV
jgi:glycosyltransferase involved in cell wall biosynthesis